MRKAIMAIAVLALVASGSLASLATVNGADHRDSPLNVANPTADINDVYAFRSPENSNNLVVAISVNPLIVPSDNTSRGVFDPSVTFQVHIDRDGQILNDEVLLNLSVNSARDRLTIDGLGAPLTVPITPANTASPVVTTAGGIKVFAGLRDDPFFFDQPAFVAFVASPQVPARGLRPASAGAPVDAFAGTNILAIVLEVPVTAVTGGSSANSGTIKAWVSSARDGSRIDRMAIPAIGTLVRPHFKDTFNSTDPFSDTQLRSSVASVIDGLRAAVDKLFGAAQDGGPLGKLTSEQVAGALLPNVVTINFANAVQFPNGRRLQDDVVDAAVGIVLNRGGAAGISDGIGANDKAFGGSFPYLADPHGSFITPTTPIQPPSTGDGGLLDTGTMWVLSAGLFVLAIALFGAGTFAAMRQRSR